MTKDKTGVQINQGHTSTDDYITRKYVLPLLRDEKMRNKLIEEHRAGPVGKEPALHKGQPVKILEESFSSEEACEHAIFLKRVVELLERYAEWLIFLKG